MGQSKIFYLLMSCLTLVNSNSLMADDDIPVGKKYIHSGGGLRTIQLYKIDSKDRNRILNNEKNDFEYQDKLFYHGTKTIKPFMSPVRDQGQRGTCTAFAAIAILEAFDNNDYSEQCLAKFSGDSDGGWTRQRLSHIKNHGIYLEKDCPYSVNRNQIPGNISDYPVFSISESFDVLSSRIRDPLNYIRGRINSGSPVGIAVFVAGSWKGPFIYEPSESEIQKECGSGKCGGHAVVVTGYDDDNQLLQFKNSWGPYWGSGGYGYMSYSYFLRLRKSYLVSY